MIAAISSEISTVKQNVYADNLMVVREPVCPAVLIECGFLSNHDEELLLQNPAYQRLLAKLIAQGAEKYLNK
jgi:N-acetylmuramoyl-L-alanine amidase